MPIRDLEQLSQSMEGLLSDEQGLNLHAQAHARSILHQLETPRTRWPHFRPKLDERLTYSANIMISRGLDLIEVPEYRALAEQIITRGAEALEFLCEVGRIKGSLPDALLKSAIAYHIVGHHARSYVLMQKFGRLEAEGDFFSELVVALIQRDLAAARNQTFAIFDSPHFEDETVVDALVSGELADDDAIANLGRRSIAAAISLYLEYLKDGKTSILEHAIILCRGVAELGRDAHHVDLWWFGRAVEKLLVDLGNSSFWTAFGEIASENPVRQYIEGNITRKPALTSLWPSQLKALTLINHPDAPSFCVRMPTSAGKTKIAEFTILRAIVDHLSEPDTKCIYIAPFRSLAVEVEATLREGLKPLGLRVSEIYGGYDVSAVEKRLIQQTQVLIATPEKLDAVIRLVPELLNGTRLVILDEGHLAGDISERGIRTEFLMNRLLYRLGREQCRFVFMSAVLPNPEDFARWIGGDASYLASSEWRPSRMVLGLCSWNGSRVRLQYSHHGPARLEPEVFVPQFLRSLNVRGVPGTGRRRNPFPYDAREAFAASAIRFTQYGSTLAFVPQARQVQPTARVILKSLGLMGALAQADGHDLSFPRPDDSTPLMQACLTAIEDELGAESEVLDFIKAGVAVHHGNLPARVRLAVERLVRVGEIRLIVATTTLGQGVNLPIRTVLVRGVWQGQDEKVGAISFWNIAGRAGRAMHENEGQILFFIDETKSRWKLRRQLDEARTLIEQSSVQAVIGLLHRALSFLREIWRQQAPEIDFETLCLKLAEDDFNWSREDSRSDLQWIFQLIDQHLLAIAVEADFEPDQADRVQEVLRESLLFAQLEAHPIPDINAIAASRILSSRLVRVFRTIPEQNRRERFYRMGFPLEDCAKVEASEAEIIEVLVSAVDWLDMTMDERMEILLALADQSLNLDTVTSTVRSLPVHLRQIIGAWLSGERCIDMIAAGLATEYEGDPGGLSRFLERICVYGLSWSVNGFVSYARQKLEEAGSQLPPIAEFFPAMFKIGVNDPLATVLAPYLQLDRRLALHVARACPYSFVDLSRAIEWLNSVPQEQLIDEGLDPEEARRVLLLRRETSDEQLLPNRRQTDLRTIRVRADLADTLNIGDTLLFRARPDRGSESYDVYTVDGRLLGRYRSRRRGLPSWLLASHLIHTTITEISPIDDETARVRIRTRQLAR